MFIFTNKRDLQQRNETGVSEIIQLIELHTCSGSRLSPGLPLRSWTGPARHQFRHRVYRARIPQLLRPSAQPAPLLLGCKHLPGCHLEARLDSA